MTDMLRHACHAIATAIAPGPGAAEAETPLDPSGGDRAPEGLCPQDEDEQREGAQALAAVIVGAVADGRDLADGASEWRVDVKSVDGVRRRGNRGDVNDPLADKVFKLKLGQAAMERIGEGYRVAVLKKVNMAPSGPSESRKELTEQLVQSMQKDLGSQLVAALREGAGVNINRSAVDALFGERQNRNDQ